MAHRVAFALFHGRWPDNEIDHRDGDGGNNRPDNLRDATHRENQRNRISTIGRSTYKGVSWQAAAQKWQASIVGADGFSRHIGIFTDETAAARAYDCAAMREHGEFARLNFPVEP